MGSKQDHALGGTGKIAVTDNSPKSPQPQALSSKCHPGSLAFLNYVTGSLFAQSCSPEPGGVGGWTWMSSNTEMAKSGNHVARHCVNLTVH